MAIEATTSQQYSFTERKRIRKSFAKRASVLKVPFLLETQLASYRAFLQADSAPDKRKNEGLQAAFTSIFPISSHSGNARLEFVSFSLLAPAFDVTYDYNPKGAWAGTHQMTLNGKRDGFTLSDFVAGEKVGLMKRGRATAILDEVFKEEE